MGDRAGQRVCSLLSDHIKICAVKAFATTRMYRGAVSSTQHLPGKDLHLDVLRYAYVTLPQVSLRWKSCYGLELSFMSLETFASFRSGTWTDA